MKIILNTNVLEETKKRINFLFDEFPNIMVNYSGGKDSQVLLEITLKIARERNRDIHLFFLDAEFEFGATVEMVRKAMNQPNVIPHWLQAPIRLQSSLSQPVISWEIGKEWIREKEPDSMHFNVFRKENDDNAWFKSICEYVFGDEPYASLSGVRAGESFNRFRALTMTETYKGITWGKVDNKKKRQFVFYPLYDWQTSDIWHYIATEKVHYNKVYDYKYTSQFREQKMRVGGLMGEAGFYDLLIMEEFETDTYNALIKRLPELHFIRNAFFELKGLPYQFKSWEEYFKYLWHHGIVSEYYEQVARDNKAPSEEFYEQLCYNVITKL